MFKKKKKKRTTKIHHLFLENSKGEITHCCYEAVEGLSPLCVFDCDWTRIVSEPDGWDDSARMAVSHILLWKLIKQICFFCLFVCFTA